MTYEWEKHPLATHVTEDGHCYYFKDADGIWILTDPEGVCCRSASLYNGETDPETLVARTPPSREELIKQIHEHFTTIGELLDYLDVILPEHEAALNKAKEIV